jgi:hypothetical protein
MKKECGNCKNWIFPSGTSIFGNCQRLVNGVEIRIAGNRLQTIASFGCKFFNASKKNDGNDLDSTQN